MQKYSETFCTLDQELFPAMAKKDFLPLDSFRGAVKSYRWEEKISAEELLPFVRNYGKFKAGNEAAFTVQAWKRRLWKGMAF